MKKFLIEYFNFTKREQNGLVVLFVIFIAIVATNLIINNISNNQRYDFTDYENNIDNFLRYQETHFDDAEYFAFDPNTASREDFLRLGLSPKSVNAIINYREKGYKFYKPEDLQRVRTLKPEEFEAVKDYIVIEKTKSKHNYYNQQNSRKYQNYEKKEVETQHELFAFDPNTASKEELEQLGFKSWQVENITKYRSKGGKFKKPEDIKNIYGVTEEFANTLMPFIEIEEVVQNDILVEINGANEADLQNLSGIGQAYAKRIIAYRQKLGGFVNIEQLNEVYGMNTELYNQIKPYVYVEKVPIKTVNINTADYKTLVTHPYIDKEIAKAILNYREFAKKIKSTDELVKQKAINKEQYEKISIYISVE